MHRGLKGVSGVGGVGGRGVIVVRIGAYCACVV